ncbi:MAG: signal peptidase I [Patescibacteria group bacterium]
MTHIQKIIKTWPLALLLLSLVIISSLSSSSQAKAIEPGCLYDPNAYSATITAPSDNYDVYVKLAQLGQSADVEISSSNAGCRTVGKITASGNEWRKVGTVTSNGGESQFNLMTTELDGSYEYDRATILLVSQTTPACTPTTECFVDLNGMQAALQPATSEADSGTIKIFYAQKPNVEDIKEVRYYVDGVYMYRTSTLEEFNGEFIPYYGKTTSRLIEFNNGQTAVIDEAVPITNSDSLGAMLNRSAVKYQSLLIWIGIIALIVIVYHITRHIVRAIEERHSWLHAHGFIKDPPAKPLTPSRLSYIYRVDRIKKVLSGLWTVVVIGAIGIAIVLLLDSFIVRLVTVSGSSMERTFHDGQKILIDKTGVTVSKISQLDFTPSRGQIVAAYSLSRFDTQQEVSDEDIIIKRVIGLPGERIVINGNNILIYNSTSPEGFDPLDGVSWKANIIEDIGNKRLDLKLGNDEVFVIGDNRPGSIDSRANGPVALRNIIGVVHN